MEFVKYEVLDAVGLVTIDRPQALNALNTQVLDELYHIFENVIDLDVIKAVIITGAGEKAFVAGADIGEMAHMTSAQAQTFSMRGNNVMLKIENYPIPVIAAINGYAFGGGCELAMSCDIKICSDNAVFCQPEAGIGITPGFGGTQRLARLVGVGLAKEMIFTGCKIRAGEAYRLGMVNAVHPQEALLPAAIQMAKDIAKSSSVAVRNAKKAINRGISMDIMRAVEVEAELFGACFGTSDQQECMDRFLNGRKKN